MKANNAGQDLTQEEFSFMLAEEAVKMYNLQHKTHYVVEDVFNIVRDDNTNDYLIQPKVVNKSTLTMMGYIGSTMSAINKRVEVQK